MEILRVSSLARISRMDAFSLSVVLGSSGFRILISVIFLSPINSGKEFRMSRTRASFFTSRALNMKLLDGESKFIFAYFMYGVVKDSILLF